MKEKGAGGPAPGSAFSNPHPTHVWGGGGVEDPGRGQEGKNVFSAL